MEPKKTIEYRGETLNVPVYLDYQATTPLDPRVLNAMLPYLKSKFGNPHSVHHAYGWEAERAVELARRRIATLVGAQPEEIYFTSGATESNNLAIKGAATASPKERGHVVTCATEHKCVLETVKGIEGDGFDVTVLPVQSDGLIDLYALEDVMREDTVLVSIMAVNNEIGVIQPLERIGALCRARGVIFHTDAAQGVGKVPLDVNLMHIDLMSISGHKIYGPMGIGALYVRRHPNVRLTPLILGGGQENGLRSGTLPTPLCVGLGAACSIAGEEMSAESERIRKLRDALFSALTAKLPGIELNGHPECRVTGNLNISFSGIDADELVTELDDLAVSTASACTSAVVGPSYVLRAMGISDEQAHGSVRICIGRFTTETEVEFAIDRIVETVQKLCEGG